MSNTILVIAEHRDGSLKNITYEMISEAARLAGQTGGAVETCVLGSLPDDKLQSMAHYGAQKIHVADSPELGEYSAEAYSSILYDIIKNVAPAVVFIPATTQGIDFAPRLAAKLDTGLASECTAIETGENGKLIFTRPIYASKVIAKVSIDEALPQMATLRPNVFPLNEPDSSKSAQVENVQPVVEQVRAVVKEFIKQASTRPELTEASIIVSGGRGMKGPENFAMLEELADVLKAAVGASRAVVDAGWRPHSDQVGQTGKVVSPTLYIACAISGAIQHMAGMSSSKIIVAINKDPEAPIFAKADYGIVGDAFEIVPLLKKEMEQLLASS